MPPVPWREENYEAKEEGKKSIHFNGSHENIELLLRTVISAKRAQYLRSNSRFMQRVTQRSGAPEKPAAPDHLEKMEIPTDLSIAEHSTNAQ